MGLGGRLMVLGGGGGGALALVTLVLLGETGVSGAEAGQAAVAQQIREIVRRDFYDPVRLPAFEALLDSESRRADRIDAALDALDSSHTGLWAPDRIDYYELFDVFSAFLEGHAMDLFPPDGAVVYAGIGVIPREIDGKTFAAYVYHGSPAARAGIGPGDEILSVDGRPFQEIASFEGREGQTAELEILKSPGTRPVRISVPIIGFKPGSMLREAIRQSVRVVEKDGRRLGYIRLWTYAGPDIRDLVVELLTHSPLVEAEGLVLDLRGRWGGAPPDAAEMFVGGAPHLELIGRDGSVTSVNWRWRKPLVGIIDEGTRSGMEVLAYSLAKAGVLLVGRRTAGAVLGGRPYVLADGRLLLLAVVDVRVEGERLEGVGVAPALKVRADLRYSDGSDPRLDRALEVLRALLVEGR